MTERQRKTIIKLKLEIEGLKLKYKERGRIISKRIDRKRRFNCFICGRKWEDNFVCANCVNDDLTKLNERIIILEGNLK